ncbi:uncharacterized protein [Dysidea avara]|uniref:uncharacterized protein n=1 Tax=Dysidea avara TaxID=196820 RepID=UPI00331A6764
MDIKENWTTDDVCQFISKEGFDNEVVELFRDNRIRGRTLPLLSDNDLRELGIKALGDRKHLLQLIKIRSNEDLEHQQPTTSHPPNSTEDEFRMGGADLPGLDDLSTDDDEHDQLDDIVEEVELGSSSQLPPKMSKTTDQAQSAAAQCVIVLDHEEKIIPDPFPFPVTYGAAVDVALHTG